MKDEEFQKGLEKILKTFYSIDQEGKKYIEKKKYKPYSKNTPILYGQYEAKK